MEVPLVQDGEERVQFIDGGGFDLPLPRHLGRSHEGAGLRCGAAGEREQAGE